MNLLYLEQLKQHAAKITNDDMRSMVFQVYFDNPDLFEIPSSRTGKYHYRDEWKRGGQWLHTKRAFRIMEHLLDTEKKVGLTTRDALLAAILIHDVNKAIDPRDEACGPKYLIEEFEPVFGDTTWFWSLVECVAIHAGKWTPDPMQVGDINFIYNPQRKMHHYMHLADYFASRGDIKIEVDRRRNEINHQGPFKRFIAKYIYGWY